jgi:hypothetical protein
MIELSQGEVHDFSGEVKKFQGNAREVRTTPRLIPSKSGDAFIKDGKITCLFGYDCWEVLGFHKRFGD